MRKGAVFVLALISVLLVGATVLFYSKYRKSVADYTQATADQETMRGRYDRAVSEIVMIQDSLNAIVLGGNGVQTLPVGGEREVQVPGTLHDQVLTRIATLKGAIERTKERIQELDTRLKTSRVKIVGLERMIAGLRKTAAEKEEQIAMLSAQVGTLQTQVTGLTTEVQEQQQDLTTKQQELAEKQHELATIFYTMGTKKELTRNGVVASKGGVLGLGKTLKQTGTFNETAFTPLDTDQDNVIRIPSDKAQVLSAQPVTSYVIQPVGKDLVELRILDPKEFRKVKHLVILMT
jgi:predicted RNase H-like nuclease (RuvC/YqgF family)